MHNNNLINFLYGLATKYPTPSNLTYFWNFGVFSFFALIIQIVTGILLVMHYTPHVDLAFSSIEHIMRDLDWGWLLRYTHANGASLFFIVMYLHIARSLLYGSYVSRSLLWSSGVIIFLLTIITAFLGYILPWGQMSLWGATVITNLASAIPVIGNTVVISLWGGFSVANPTLNRFFSLHYFLPFLILVLVLGHLFLLHISGSNNPLGTGYRIDGVQFGPYYIVKDIFSLSPLLIFFFWLILFIPNELGHPDNYILANSDITPAHIVPEWYFLIFYGILRSILSKSIGIILMLFSILLLFILVLKYQKVRTVLFQKVYHIITLLFIFIVVSLGYIGSKSIEAPYFSTGQKLTLGYFIVFLLYFFGDKFDSFFIKTALSTNVPRKNLVWGEAIKKFAEHKDSVAGFFVTGYQACKTTWNNFNKIDKTPPKGRDMPPNNEHENENSTTFDSNQISNENVPVKDFVKEHFK